MAIKRYDGNRQLQDLTYAIRVWDINNVLREVHIGETVDLAPAIIAQLDPIYVLTDSTNPPPPSAPPTYFGGPYLWLNDIGGGVYVLMVGP